MQGAVLATHAARRERHTRTDRERLPARRACIFRRVRCVSATMYVVATALVCSSRRGQTKASQSTTRMIGRRILHCTSRLESVAPDISRDIGDFRQQNPPSHRKRPPDTSAQREPHANQNTAGAISTVAKGTRPALASGGGHAKKQTNKHWGLAARGRNQHIHIQIRTNRHPYTIRTNRHLHVMTEA